MLDHEEVKPLPERLREDLDGENNPDLESQPEALSSRRYDKRIKLIDLL
ncbi:hypothetical protein SAMN05444487_11934 [Marininema mesophilum]|uniref:Uncharacterized protein n=1 Tax=Marininema mesophilum TaxID=1048340 RepID=A0A1H3C296_9BACL|nr:hypothetical protein [Marininema mesophilum]SDX48185.1 hypothetical protein SAMN05444487_11934 [Marininema mesophilum]